MEKANKVWLTELGTEIAKALTDESLILERKIEIGNKNNG